MSTVNITADDLAELVKKKDLGQIADVWNFLGSKGDAYAYLAGAIVADDTANMPVIARLFYEMVRSQWGNTGAAGAWGEAVFKDVGKQHLENYLNLLGSRGSSGAYQLPDTIEIETSYKAALNKSGLPPIVAIDSLFSVVDLAWGNGNRQPPMDFSWAQFMDFANTAMRLSGAPAPAWQSDRIRFNSEVFKNDVDPVFAVVTFGRTLVNTLERYGAGAAALISPLAPAYWIFKAVDGAIDYTMVDFARRNAAYVVFKEINPSLSPTAIDALLDAVDNNDRAGFGTALDWVGKLLGVALPASNASPAQIFDNVKTLNDSATFAAFKGKVTFSVATSSIATTAKTDFASFLALNALSPLVISTTDAGAIAALKAANPTLATAWQADSTARSANTSTALNYSDNWHTDRAAMLMWQVEVNKADAPATSTTPYAPENALGLTAVPSQYFSDLASGKELYLGGPDRRRFVFGTDQADAIEGGGYSDRLYGGADNDTLDGKGANDYLEGGTGEDTYQFSGSWGKDIVCDTDSKGNLTIEGLTLGMATANGERNQWIAKTSPTAFYVLTVVDDARSSTGKALTITSALNTSNSITIQNFDLTEAKKPTGYLGVMLEPTVKVATMGNNLPAGQSNFFNPAGADASSLAGQASNVVEGTGKTISVYLNQAAKAGETAVLNLQNLASAGMKAILGDSVVDANGATITLVDGQTEIRFALIQDGALSADVSGSVSVTYNGTGGSVTSNAWGVNIKDAGATSKTYNGDQRAPLNGSGNYDWACTSWASNGTLNGGVAEPGFSDVLRGAADNDTISGLGGNDALDGGAGNDTIDGGTGDDLIGGGAGSDNIRGGDGNDFINTSATLNMGGRVSPTDSWSPPSGQAVITQGARWGIYKDTMPDATPVTVWGGSNSPAGNEADVVDAGAGNDRVIASGGDDRVQGGLGDDQLDGMGGNDVIEGGDGKDSINGDGRIQTGFLDSVAAPYHGADFVDGGAGDDVLVGGSGADSMDGGTGNNTYVVDNVGDVIVDALGVATNSVAACARQTGVNGRFGSKPHGRHLNTQLLRARAARSTRQSPHARSMRPAGQKWPGRRMNSAQSTLMAGVL